MARKKTITKEQILSAAYEVATTEGFSRFTARNIANKMNCSTQPIYLEFKNMDDLKRALFVQIYDYLKYEVFPVVHTGNTIIDLAYNYIHFANREKKLYSSLYLEEYGGERRCRLSLIIILYKWSRTTPNMRTCQMNKSNPCIMVLGLLLQVLLP